MEKAVLKGGMTIRALKNVFERELKPLLNAQSDVTLTLPEDEPMDCAFLQTLFEIKKTLNEKGRTFLVENLPPLYRAFFE